MADIEEQLTKMMSGEAGYDNRQRKWGQIMETANYHRLKEEVDEEVEEAIEEGDIKRANKEEHVIMKMKGNQKPKQIINDPTP